MAKIGDKVKYTKPDLPGRKEPKEITPGEIYTIKDFREPPQRETKRPGDVEYQLQEVPESWYSHERFEPVPKSHKGSVPGIS